MNVFLSLPASLRPRRRPEENLSRSLRAAREKFVWKSARTRLRRGKREDGAEIFVPRRGEERDRDGGNGSDGGISGARGRTGGNGCQSRGGKWNRVISRRGNLNTESYPSSRAQERTLPCAEPSIAVGDAVRATPILATTLATILAAATVSVGSSPGHTRRPRQPLRSRRA